MCHPSTSISPISLLYSSYNCPLMQNVLNRLADDCWFILQYYIDYMMSYYITFCWQHGASPTASSHCFSLRTTDAKTKSWMWSPTINLSKPMETLIHQNTVVLWSMRVAQSSRMEVSMTTPLWQRTLTTCDMAWHDIDMTIVGTSKRSEKKDKKGM